VRVQLVSEQVLSVDDNSRAIIWSVDPLRKRASPMPLGHNYDPACPHIFWLDEGGGTPQNRLNKIRSGGGRGSRCPRSAAATRRDIRRKSWLSSTIRPNAIERSILRAGERCASAPPCSCCA